ncbi:hypothetical protein RJT34_27479 [Clitoria ternatea]|uniref:Choline kinase n=1 Tax=Clitoria ternatea TaxID=43366 RepID=A0AAN9F883_CLITE
MSTAEDLVNKTAGAAESSVNLVTDPAENPKLDRAGSTENLVKDKNPVAENLDSEQAGSAEISVNNKESAVENSIDDKEGASENFTDDKTGEIENSSSKQTDGTENVVKDEQDPSENPVEDEAHDVETPVNSKEDRFPAEAREILESLASNWEDVLDPKEMQVVPLKGAMTNEVSQIKWQTTTGETSRKVLVRIYGEGVDVFFDRNHEIQTFEFMSKMGQGPRLLGRFANGRVEEFIHARTLSASDLRDPSISALIAAKLKEFHDLDMPGERKVHLWDTLRNWLSAAKQISNPKEVEAFYLDRIDKEISLLEKELSGVNQRIGFCHNDLQYGNIMLDEETNSVTIIDYEYAAYNPVAYDIANHFCEMAANYHTENPHILEYNKYPDFEERKRFVKAYLSSSGQQPNDDEVKQPNDDEVKKPANDEVKQPPNEDEAKQPPNEDEGKQPPNEDEAKQPPNDDEAKQPPSDDEAKQSPSDDEAKQSPSDGEAKQSPSDDEAKQSPSDGEAKQPPSDGEAKQTPNGDEAKQPPNGDEAKQPPNGDEVQTNDDAGEQPNEFDDAVEQLNDDEGEQSNDKEVKKSNDDEVERLLNEIEKYTLANHLFWGIWGIISAQVNKIEFDYKEYAKQRFQEYWARKPFLLTGSTAPPRAPEAGI